ncbi:MAG: 4-hydroxythreonine-4-phosphate dehydrogenase PdxA [Bacteroidota bacterium]
MSTTKRNTNIKVGISMGDVNGIGPELVLKTFDDSRMKNHFTPVVYGSVRALNIYRKILHQNKQKFHYSIIQNASQAQGGRLNIVECAPKLERVEIGKPSKSGAEVAHQALKLAVEDAQHGMIDALVTLPVDKSTFQQHESSFSGHTEYLAKAFGVNDNLMLMVSEELRVGLVTNHLPLKEVSRNLSKTRVLNKIKLMHQCLQQDFSCAKPLIAVLGLNPHAGDNGLIGGEEQQIISGAIQEASELGIMATGPYPPDGFFGSLSYRKFDGILAMYHDQGLIPFKLISGYRGVNFTAGIPFVRTSPDHGVAYDITGKDLADPESFRQAIFTAIDVFKSRSEYLEAKENALPGMNTEWDFGDEEE